MKIFLMLILAFVISVTVCVAQIHFEIPRGKDAAGFSFTQGGDLKYKGKDFSPPVTVDSNVEKFRIAFLPDKGLAGAIAVDSAENSFLLLNTQKYTSEESAEISAPQKMFLSPSRKFLVVYGEYEGAWLYSINLVSKKIRRDEGWFPADKGWVLTNTPRWVGKSDVLFFKVVVGCSDHYDPEFPCKEKSSFYEVQVDAASLRIKNKRSARR